MEISVSLDPRFSHVISWRQYGQTGPVPPESAPAIAAAGFPRGPFFRARFMSWNLTRARPSAPPSGVEP